MIEIDASNLTKLDEFIDAKYGAPGTESCR